MVKPDGQEGHKDHTCSRTQSNPIIPFNGIAQRRRVPITVHSARSYVRLPHSFRAFLALGLNAGVPPRFISAPVLQWSEARFYLDRLVVLACWPPSSRSEAAFLRSVPTGRECRGRCTCWGEMDSKLSLSRRKCRRKLLLRFGVMLCLVPLPNLILVNSAQV